MIKLILLFVSIALAQKPIASQKNQSPFQKEPTYVQTVLARAGLNLVQCRTLREGLNLGSKACLLLEAEYMPFIIRARGIAIKVKHHNTNIEKIASLLKEFPETTDEWVIKNLQETKEDIETNNEGKIIYPSPVNN